MLLAFVAVAPDGGYVAVGDEVHRRLFLLALRHTHGLHPVVVVLDDHQLVAARQLLLVPEDAPSDALVIGVGALVGARDDDCLVCAAAVIGIFQRFDEFAAGHHPDVREPLQAQLWECIHLLIRNQLPQHRGVPEDAAVGELAHHLRECELVHLQPVACQEIRLQSRTELLAHGWQLRRIAHQHQAAALAGIDELDEVVQQVSRAEGTAAQALVADHRGLVHDEQRVLQQVDILHEIRHLARECLLPVDAFVDGVGRVLGVQGKDLRRPSRRSHQHSALLERVHALDQCAHERCLSRAGIASQNKHRVALLFKQEVSHHSDGFFLLFGGLKPEFLEDEPPHLVFYCH